MFVPCAEVSKHEPVLRDDAMEPAHSTKRVFRVFMIDIHVILFNYNLRSDTCCEGCHKEKDNHRELTKSKEGIFKQRNVLPNSRKPAHILDERNPGEELDKGQSNRIPLGSSGVFKHISIEVVLADE
jgi:hypothetical protein